MHYVFLVEDDEDIQYALREVIEACGHQVRAVSTGREALDFLSSTEKFPFLILLDVTMPDMSGPEFRALQLENQQMAKIPTVFLSGVEHLSTIAKEWHADGFLQKPFSLKAVMEVIQRFAVPQGRPYEAEGHA